MRWEFFKILGVPAIGFRALIEFRPPSGFTLQSLRGFALQSLTQMVKGSFSTAV